jgi:glycosyltransferase involved in cell wall biosynthesis
VGIADIEPNPDWHKHEYQSKCRKAQMKILYIHQHFATPLGSTGTRSYEFARRWVKAGHQVTVITGLYDIGGLDGTRRLQEIEGIKVIAVGTKYDNKMSFARRVVAFITFMFAAICKGLNEKNVDVMYATSTPLTIGIPAMSLKWLKGTPFVFEVRDQWPEIPIEMGIIKNKVLIWLLLRLEHMIYKSASALVALSPGIADDIRKVTGDSKKTEMIPNSSDISIFHPGVDGTNIREKHSWKNKFVLLHFGAVGRANGLGFILDAAKSLKDQNSIHFVIVGEGSTKDELVRKAESLKLNNVEFVGTVSKQFMPQYVAACDVSIVIFANYPILEHNSANKFFDSLSAGKPILLNYSGWQREVIESNNAGFGCKQCDVGEFVSKILALRADNDKLKQFGLNARKLAEKWFDRDILASQVLNLLKSICNAGMNK